MVTSLRATAGWRGAAAVAFALAVGAAVASCGDDEPCVCQCAGAPGPSSTSGGTTGSGGGGGEAPGPCVSNSDCAAPAAICDTAKGACVECLVASDCALRPGTLCSKGSCVCPQDGASWCAPDLCVDLQSSPDHCGACGHQCFGTCGDGKCADPWEPTSTLGAPAGRAQHVAVWTGKKMIVWGGWLGTSPNATTNTGGIYDPAAYEWSATSTIGAPSPRRQATAVWTGKKMIVWGGMHGDTYLGAGGIFDPEANSWKAMTAENEPPGRINHSAIWTGNIMIVWGGRNQANQLASGGLYDPDKDVWKATVAPPVPRELHSAVWSGSSMLVYGGVGDDGHSNDVYLPTAYASGGMEHDPVADAWTSLPFAGEPTARAGHSALMLGQTMALWGGYNGASYVGTGAQFNIATKQWQPMSPPLPDARAFHSAVLLTKPKAMIVWGGVGAGGVLDSGGMFDPDAGTWTPTPSGPSARSDHSAVSTGGSMIVWGGLNGDERLGTGGVLAPPK
ncbi:MAG: hypothetical protein HY744_25330 [Deltaproteobacteria bacterium]|nr:hypothetical protein [Deltaproteobacteria bacterium]